MVEPSERCRLGILVGDLVVNTPISHLVVLSVCLLDKRIKVSGGVGTRITGAPMKDTNTELLPEEEFTDVKHIGVTKNATIRIQSDLFGAEFDTYRHDSLQCGVTVIQDGSHLALSAGTVNENELPHLYAHCGLTPEQAREIADALNTAADAADESMQGGSEPEEDTQSFLKRLARRVA